MNLPYKQAYLEHVLFQKHYAQNTHDAYEKDLNEFEVFLKDNCLKQADVDHKTIRYFMTHLLEKNNARRTIARKLSSLRGYYRYLLKMGYQTSNPLDLIDKQRYKQALPEYLSKEEIKELLTIAISKNEAINLRNRTLILLLYASGIRVSEAVFLKLEDVDLKQQMMVIKQTKGGQDRIALLSQEAAALLRVYVQEGRPSFLISGQEKPPFVFLNAKGKQLTARGMELIIKKMGLKLKQPKSLYPHMLRHSLATHLLDQGADLRSIQELLGHKNLSATQIYTHVSTKKMKETYEMAQPRKKQ